MIDNKLNVLIYRIGSLSSSLIRHFNSSPLINKVYVLEDNDTPLMNFEWFGSGKDTTIGKYKEFLKEKNIDFVIVNREDYLVSGIIDFHQKQIGIPVIGASKQWFDLEASKIYGKNFMLRQNIKNPDYRIVYDKNQIKDIIKEFSLPLVIKNNNLMAGFGSYICRTKGECIKKAKEIIKDYSFCIAEKYIKGSEITQHYIWDENTLIPLMPVKDFKAFKGGDKVINTGGMGSYTPVNLTDKQVSMLNEYNERLKQIFNELKPNFTGIFAVNLLFSDNDLYTLEFNMRPGITEFETLIELFDFDLLELYYNIALKQAHKTPVKYKNNLISGCVTVVDKHFIDRKNKNVKFPLEKLIPVNSEDILINYHCSDVDKNNFINADISKKLYTVVNTDSKNPFDMIYKYLDKVKCSNVYYRKDIGDVYEK